jgi:hypothetical protein
MNEFFPEEGVVTLDTVDPFTGRVTGRSSQNIPTINVSANAVKRDRMTQNIVQDNLGRGTSLLPEDLSEGTRNLKVPNTKGDSPANPIDAQTNFLKKESKDYKKAELALSGAKFAADIMNAQLQYNQIVGQAQFNIQMARNQAKDSLYRGRLAASQAQSQGRAASDQAILAMAAQGQDVSSAGVQRIAGSYEAISEQNAMQLEINAMREALGFELEVVNYNFQKNSAKINRDMTILSSALNFGAKAYGLGGL